MCSMDMMENITATRKDDDDDDDDDDDSGGDDDDIRRNCSVNERKDDGDGEDVKKIHPTLSRSRMVMEYLRNTCTKNKNIDAKNNSSKFDDMVNGDGDDDGGKGESEGSAIHANGVADDAVEQDNDGYSYNHNSNKRQRIQYSARSENQSSCSDCSCGCGCFEIRRHPCPPSTKISSLTSTSIISGRGLGMYATRNIRCGELIVQNETPIVAVATASTMLSSSFRGRRRRRPRKHEQEEREEVQHPHGIPLFCDRCCAPLQTLKIHYEQLGKIDGLSWSEFCSMIRPIPNNVNDQEPDHPRLNDKHKSKWLLLQDLEFVATPEEPNDEKRVESSNYLYGCSDCEVTWCSKQCYDAGKQIHNMIDCRKIHEQLRDIDVFLNYIEDGSEFQDDENENTKKDLDVENKIEGCQSQSRKGNDIPSSCSSVIFELAIRSVAVAIVAFFDDLSGTASGVNSDRSNCQHHPISRYCWWNDFTSRPLWWEISEPPNDDESDTAAARRKELDRRKALTAMFSNILTGTFLNTCNIDNGSDHDDGNSKQPIEDLIRKVCSVDSLGRILGMLQCNVMEFEYPSPFQQCIEEYEYCVEMENAEQQQDAHDDCSSNKDDQDHSCHSRQVFEASTKRPIPPSPVVGSGLYPILTLANHDCDPNASIEFLEESNVGSMVAIRDIRKGEEITNTYIPNGDLDPSLSGKGRGTLEDGDNEEEVQNLLRPEEVSDRFRHFRPTRTWKWLHGGHSTSAGSLDGYDDDGSCGVHSGNGSDRESSIEDTENNEDEDNIEAAEEEDDGSASQQAADGADHLDRSLALLDYNFVCQCDRCIK